MILQDHVVVQAAIEAFESDGDREEVRAHGHRPQALCTVEAFVNLPACLPGSLFPIPHTATLLPCLAAC